MNDIAKNVIPFPSSLRDIVAQFKAKAAALPLDQDPIPLFRRTVATIAQQWSGEDSTEEKQAARDVLNSFTKARSIYPTGGGYLTALLANEHPEAPQWLGPPLSPEEQAKREARVQEALKQEAERAAPYSGPLLQSAPASSFKMKRIRWAWPNRIAIGELALIVGMPDEGKGQILYYSAATITRGGEWPCGEGRAPAISAAALGRKIIAATPLTSDRYSIRSSIWPPSLTSRSWA
jgi:hypothetical protein